MAEIAEKLKIVAKIRQITHQPENISGALQNVKNILSLNKECIDIHTNKLWTCFCNSILFILTAPIRLFCIKPDYKLHSLGEKFRVEIDNRLKP